MIIPGQKSTETEIEQAATLGSMESGAINGVGSEDMAQALQGMTKEQLKNFVNSTEQRAKERR